MTLISTDVIIDRPPAEVFGYVTDPAKFGEWQTGVVDGCIKGDKPPAVGSLCTMTRRLGGANRTSTSEITEIRPPATWAIHGIDGPVRADVSVLVEATDDGSGSHVTIGLEFHGHGFGRMLIPMVERQARKEMAQNIQQLKQRLEG